MTFVKNVFPHAQSLNALKSCSLFNGIEDEKLALLLENCGHIRFKSGEILNHEGEPFKHCPLMISGQMEVYRHTYLGEEKIFGLFCTGEIVAIAAVFMPHNRYPMSLRAKTDGEALLLDKRDILRLCHACPQIMEKLLRRFSSKLYENINHIDWLTSSSAEQRLAAYILDLKHKQLTSNIVLPLSRGQLAAKLGIRYETLSRLVSGWRQKGFIDIEKDTVHIHNENYLTKLSISAQRPF
ncbi:Crp/Fnr family transcriptional regulator [Providencia hangzhouensis]|uniref:Fumarate and nitrate reduction regulatory protein n=1 Tax=Providencia rettgeri TaxID=587 RepID=A0A9N8D6B0_PRORE|nr:MULTISPECIES: Crp/Fnr family transcriptional regulator [Providencia]MBN7841291.1 Crp/Fnr family transcriptional regulator [Providencia rettgeri]MBN7854376.1 Crp/Fnr family transcriptional regulator [Providencia rettgeri]MBN7861326.1 Crp/Fnr family transcriptional regulator [Providencia rettgeri]MBN7870825.1 Crp/Fnr family transcriptional regulator [Providencia rettgeri]MBN7896994.1 Crp/Fnr family transcriptional regulator [Providencia rettgeri]